MNTYDAFHGQILISNIGKTLREISKKEKTHFKVMTGYGSSTGQSQSKIAVLKSLRLMKKEGLIQGFLPGEVKHHILFENSPYYIYLEDKLRYETLISKDVDYGNPGIVFIFK
jgi:hypothetical protein